MAERPVDFHLSLYPHLVAHSHDKRKRAEANAVRECELSLEACQQADAEATWDEKLIH